MRGKHEYYTIYSTELQEVLQKFLNIFFTAAFPYPSSKKLDGAFHADAGVSRRKKRLIWPCMISGLKGIPMISNDRTKHKAREFFSPFSFRKVQIFHCQIK